MKQRTKVLLCAYPKAQYDARSREIREAIRRVLDSGWYILGKEVEAFEAEFASYIGTRHAVGVGNGTDALHLALRCLGIGSGDEVITVSHTAVATVAAIEMAGATPVLVDIDPTSYTLDPDLLEQKITKKTKAIVPVHLYGHPADMKAIGRIAKAHRLRVVEDCAQAHGAAIEVKAEGGNLRPERGRVTSGNRSIWRKCGTFGDMACFSFYPTKNLGAIGDGGAIVTDNAELAERARRLRQYGWAERYVSAEAGWNTRLDELQAAILRVKLRHLDADNRARQALAARYIHALKATSLVLPETRKGMTHVYHLFVVRSASRDALAAAFQKRGIQAAIHYPVPVHLQPAYRNRRCARLPETEKAAREVLSLPLYPELSVRDMDAVIKAVKESVS